MKIHLIRATVPDSVKWYMGGLKGGEVLCGSGTFGLPISRSIAPGIYTESLCPSDICPDCLDSAEYGFWLLANIGED